MPSLSFAVLPPFLLNLGPDFVTIFCPTAIGNEGRLKIFPLSPFIHFFLSRYNLYCCCLVTKSCLTLCNLMDCSLPGSFVHGISQARILEWVAIPFSRGSSCPRDPWSLALQADLYLLNNLGAPWTPALTTPPAGQRRPRSRRLLLPTADPEHSKQQS